jgi:hypothetical protein
MNRPGLQDSFIFVDSPEEMIKAGKHVQAGKALAVVLHNAFQPEDALPISRSIRNSLAHHKATIKQGTHRPALERQSRDWLPIMNMSPELDGEDYRLLPPVVAGIAIGLQNAVSPSSITKMPTFAGDEFRNVRSRGVMHTDPRLANVGLNMHTTGLGGHGTLGMVDSHSSFNAGNDAVIYFVPEDQVMPDEIKGDLYTTPLYPGSIAAFSALGDKTTRRDPVPHIMTTDTDIVRNSISIDQLQHTFRAIGDLPRRATKNLAAEGIDLSAHFDALRKFSA